MSVYKKLIEVQNKLKAPKTQYNSFGKYYYRNCEDILEAVKPILDSIKASLFIKDEIELIGDRFYVKAIVTFIDIETGENFSVSALARESEDKKGMDSAQVTGATSSYARKYALNGLFLIDDTKDNDHDSMHQTDKTKEELKQARLEKEEKEKLALLEKQKADELALHGKLVRDLNELMGDNTDMFEKSIVKMNKTFKTEYKGFGEFNNVQLQQYINYLNKQKESK